MGMSSSINSCARRRAALSCKLILKVVFLTAGLPS